MTDSGLLCRRAVVIHNRPMLGFFDESGDPGLKVGRGSSRYFVVALVTFDDDDEALRCDRRIDSLRAELGLSNRYEFHFAENSRRVRQAFLRAVQPFHFEYHTFVLDKTSGISDRLPFNSPEGLYKYTAGLLFENASGHLHDVALVIDKGGNREFRAGLLQQLRSSANPSSGGRPVRRIKQQDSHRNNLLQLADYVASITNQATSGKRETKELLSRYLERKEVTRGGWTI